MVQQHGHFNPRSPCGERPRRNRPGRRDGHFNPRSPCGERPGAQAAAGREREFQSTLPVWGATVQLVGLFQIPGISIHAPRVGSDSMPAMVGSGGIISIHAPRVGSDPGSQASACNKGISIHAPRVGSDLCLALAKALVLDFNPRSPCGERPSYRASLSPILPFQSTLPVWGATAKMHRFFFCIFGKKGIFCDILQIGCHLQGIGRKRRGDFLSRSVRTSRGKYGCLAFAFRESGGLRENRRFYSQSVLFSFRIDCQGSRIAGCPFRGP